MKREGVLSELVPHFSPLFPPTQCYRKDLRACELQVPSFAQIFLDCLDDQLVLACSFQLWRISKKYDNCRQRNLETSIVAEFSEILSCTQ